MGNIRNFFRFDLSARRVKTHWNLIWKSSRFFPFGANLTHCGSKSVQCVLHHPKFMKILLESRIHCIHSSPLLYVRRASSGISRKCVQCYMSAKHTQWRRCWWSHVYWACLKWHGHLTKVILGKKCKILIAGVEPLLLGSWCEHSTEVTAQQSAH